MDATPTVGRTRPGPPHDPPVPRPLPPGPYELRLADLRTRWPGGEIIGFGGADVVLPPGRRVAVLGGSRVGASALAAVLMGFLDYQGVATLNDVQIRDLAGVDVRGVVGFCARDSHVFDGTVAENVRSARPGATEKDVAAALARAGVTLSADARVGERETAGLERQRIALARALLADLPVLLLEEPEAGPQERCSGEPDALLDSLFTAAAVRTLVVIMHRQVVPGAAPILRRVDEVLTLGGSSAH